MVEIMTVAMTTDVVMIVAMIGDMTMTAGVIARVETRIIVGKLFQYHEPVLLSVPECRKGLWRLQTG